MRIDRWHSRFKLGLCLGAALLLPISVEAFPPAAIHYDLPSQSLADALHQVARQSGAQIMFSPDQVAGLSAPRLVGDFDAQEAVERLIAGAGLVAEQSGGTIVIRGRSGPPRAGVASTAEAQSDIVVTGSRIRGAGPIGSNVVTIGRNAIDESGFGTVQDLLQQLPQNYGGGSSDATAGLTGTNGAGQNTSYGSSINLRGLGPSSTLVLLNGNRPPLGGLGGTFADVSMLPISAIDRIEVLPDGASAIYGSDAVAGVVNIIPRTNFRGLETSIRYGSADGDFTEVQASAIVGKHWSSGHVILAYEYDSRGRLSASDRSFATEDLRAFGGPDYRTGFSNPGTIVAGGTTYAIPKGQNGSGIAAGNLTPGTSNLQDGWLGADLLPRQRRQSVYASLSQNITDRLSLSAEGLFSERRYNKHDNSSGYNATVSVPPSNPFYVNPGSPGAPVQVEYSFRDDFGPLTDEGVVKAYGGTLGAHLDLGPWQAQINGTYGRQDEQARTINRVNTARLAQALADPDPATSFDIFGDGSWTSPATIARIRGLTETDDSDTLWTAAAKADGPLFALPAGDVRLAVGAEYRREKFTSSSIADTATLTPIFSRGTWPGAREVAAVFGEVLAPIVSDADAIPGVRSLTLSAAGRYEHYNEFGSTTNPKLGLSWSPLPGLSIRSTFGTSFRAPSFVDLLQTPTSTAYGVFPLADPTSPTGTRNALLLTGNRPDIGPERATTWTVGFDVKPSMLPDFNISATYFNIRYRDRIAGPGSAILNILQNRATYAGIITDSPSLVTVDALYASPYFINLFGIPASDVSAIIDARTQNLSVVEETGLDFSIDYSHSLLGGRLALDLAGTWLFRLDQAFTRSAPEISILNTVGNPVDLRLRAGGSWAIDEFSFAAHVNFTDGYRNTIPIPAEHVSAWTTVDAQIGYSFDQTQGALHGLRLSLSATNLLDRAPPYVNFAYPGITAVGYDPQNASAVGRVISFEITKSW